MGLRNLHRILEQAGGMGGQIKQLDAQINQAKAELESLKSSPGGTISDLEKQLSTIYKQIEDAKNARMEKEELEYFQGLVTSAEKILDQMWDYANQQAIMEREEMIEEILEQVSSADPNQSLKDQVNQLKSQIVAMRKQEKEAKQNAADSKKLKDKQEELENINKEKEEYQSYSSEKEKKVSDSLNRRIDNANKALKNFQSVDTEAGKDTVSEQAPQPLTPEQEKEKTKLEKQIQSLTNEMGSLNRRIAKISATLTEDSMSGLQSGYADVSYGDDSSYNFQSHGPLGSEPELEDEGFTTFYGDSDSQWGAYNFSSDGAELGEDPESIMEESEGNWDECKCSNGTLYQVSDSTCKDTKDLCMDDCSEWVNKVQEVNGMKIKVTKCSNKIEEEKYRVNYGNTLEEGTSPRLLKEIQNCYPHTKGTPCATGEVWCEYWGNVFPHGCYCRSPIGHNGMGWDCEVIGDFGPQDPNVVHAKPTSTGGDDEEKHMYDIDDLGFEEITEGEEANNLLLEKEWASCYCCFEYDVWEGGNAFNKSRCMHMQQRSSECIDPCYKSMKKCKKKCSRYDDPKTQKTPSQNMEEEFKSKAQARYFHAKANEKGKEGKKWKKWAKEFGDDTKDFSKLPEKKKKKKKKVKEIQVWGINSNPGFGLGDVPRDKMYSDVPRPAHMNVMGLSEMKKPKMKKGKLLEYLSELTTRGGTKGKVYKKKDLTKQSGPYTEKPRNLDEIKKIISKLAENKQSLQEVPIDYEDRPERINPNIERQLSTQDTAFGKDHPAFPKVGEDEVYDNYEELIASQRFKDVVDTFKRHTGIQGNATDMQNLMGLQGMMMQSLQNTLRIEASNKQRLEDLAVEIVTKDLNVPEGSLQFDVEITGMKKLSKDDMKQKPKNKEESLEQEEETLEHIEELDLEVAKRRFINSMMQGSAKKALYLYHMVSDELNSIDPTLMNLYGVVISANDLMYWIMPDMMGAGGGEGAPVFGKEKIDLSTTPPTVVAKGMTFPVLVHELHKGVMEYLSLHGLPGDKELRQKVMDKTDFLEDEMWDLRLGPGLWERFIDAIGADDFDVKNHLYSEIIQMPAKQFLDFMKEIQSGSEKGKQMMVDLAKRIKDDIQKDEYEDATGEYEEEDVTTLEEPMDDIDISDLFPAGSEMGGGPIELDIDTILDKISDGGMDSLTPDELQFLKDQ